jgi:Zn-dependent M28 family amino/carboxypeptidase
LITTCGVTSGPPEFDGTRAFLYLESQVALGPRNPGSAGWLAFHDYLRSFCDSLQLNLVEQPFVYYDYLKDDSVSMINFIVKINPDHNRRILVAAHYDCRPFAENDPDPELRTQPIPGANDGASGVAVIMHFAELMVEKPPPLGVDLIFFDGEDYGPPGKYDQYVIGSSYFGNHNETHYEYGLLLDMIGDKNLRIYREKFSQAYAPDITDRVWAKAAELGDTAFVDSVRHSVMDDHLPLIASGIPTTDIIDFDYPYWHTHKDSPDKCSPESLARVGRVVLGVIYDE